MDIKLLSGNPLFKDINEDILRKLIESETCVIETYKKGTIIVQAGAVCNSIGFILYGTLASQLINADGDLLVINMFEANDVFGAALYKSEKPEYPFTLVSLKESQVLYLSFAQIHKLIKNNSVFNDNFISFLSERMHVFQKKLKMIQYKDVRSKLIQYLSQEYRLCQTNTFQLRHSKVAIADIIGVARPSVSREFKNMVEEGIIQIAGNRVVLVRVELF